MITSSLKYQLDFYKPDNQKNNKTFHFDFSLMGAVIWKSGSLQTVNESLTYNEVVEVYIRKTPYLFDLNYHIKINEIEYTILSINNIGNDVKMNIMRWN